MGRGASRKDLSRGRKSSVSTPRVQMRSRSNPRALSSAFEGGRGHHHGRGGRVKPPQGGIAPGKRHRQAARQIFRKARMEGGGEGPLAPHAIAPGGETERAFGGDMDRIGREGIDHGRQAPAIPRQADLRVARQRQGAKAIGPDHQHLMAHRFQLPRQRFDGADDAVDGGMPGIRHDQNPRTPPLRGGTQDRVARAGGIGRRLSEANEDTSRPTARRDRRARPPTDRRSARRPAGSPRRPWPAAACRVAAAPRAPAGPSRSPSRSR